MFANIASKWLSDTSNLLTVYCIGLHVQFEVITLKDKPGSLFQYLVWVRNFLIGSVNHYGPLVLPSSVVKKWHYTLTYAGVSAMASA